MRYLKPIAEQDASPTIQIMYQAVKRSFAVETVPLFFQYVANFEQYFTFLWKRIEEDIQTESFKQASNRITQFANHAIAVFPTPSIKLSSFVNTLHPLEKQQISETIQQLERINSILFLLLLDIREGMKSIHISTERLASHAPHGGADLQDSSSASALLDKHTSSTIKPGQQMLAPLFGTSELVVSHYPDFFTFIASEMEELQKTELYLQKRVELERKGLQAITIFVQPLGCTFKEFLTLTWGKPLVPELLYLLTDDFPSQFPHLVFTAAVMRNALNPLSPISDVLP